MKYLLPIVFLGLIVWVHYILYIGDERKMADCSGFKVFKEEMNRMCQSLEAQTLCPLKQGWVSWFCDECEGMCFQEIDFAIRTVQKWSDEHPKKTRQSKFLKMFPNAKLHFDGSLVINPCELDEAFKSEYCNSDNCHKCRAEYWLAAVE